MMPGRGVNVEVQCYAGYRGDETPREFLLGEQKVEVVDVIGRWVTPGYRYFKVRGDDDAVYTLRHDERAGRWEVVP